MLASNIDQVQNYTSGAPNQEEPKEVCVQEGTKEEESRSTVDQPEKEDSEERF